MGKMFCGIYGLEKAWYVADAKCVEWEESSRTCHRVGMDVNEWFPVNVELRQGCVMSPCLFNVYMDDVVREVNARVLRKWLDLLVVNDGRFEINQLLLADDTALVADSEQKLRRLVTEFGRVAEEEN